MSNGADGVVPRRQRHYKAVKALKAGRRSKPPSASINSAAPLTPWDARTFATPRPIPLVDPVTTAVFPASRLQWPRTKTPRTTDLAVPVQRRSITIQQEFLAVLSFLSDGRWRWCTGRPAASGCSRHGRIYARTIRHCFARCGDADALNVLNAQGHHGVPGVPSGGWLFSRLSTDNCHFPVSPATFPSTQRAHLFVWFVMFQ